MRAVIVGSGPAGLIALRSLQKFCEFDGVEFVCYERRLYLGGEWVYTGDREESYDKAGHPMNTTVYKELQMNTPTVLMPPHPDHSFPPGTTLYPKRDEMYQYLKDFAEKFCLAKYIKFGKMVSDVRFDKDKSKFHFKVIDLANDFTVDDECDYMFMCAGQYCEPRFPNVDLSKFAGETLHYHSLRDPARLNGKRILVVGGSWGAMDMIMIYSKDNRAGSLHISWHSMPPFWMKSVQNVSVHSQLVQACGSTVSFADGSSVDVDVIILCSGFKQIHPLCDELQLDFNSNRFLFPLYKHLVHPTCPRLFFLGKANSLGLYMMRPQAEFVCMLIKGRVTLPSEAEMLQDISKFQSYWGEQLAKIQEVDLEKFFPISELEFAQGNAVVEMAGLEPMQPGHCFMHLTYQILHGIYNDVRNYKNYVVEYRQNPSKPNEMLPYLVPPAKH